MKERILQLLINGIRASEIAGIVGCTASYISQLVSDPEFKASVEQGKLAVQETRTEEEHLDKRYESTEHLLLSAIADKLPEASLGEVTRAIEVINKRADMKHGRKNPAPTGPAVNINIVSLGLPAHALPGAAQPTITLNEKQEIIAIGGKALAPMSSDAVKNLFATRTAVNTQVIEDQRVIAEI